MGFPIHFDNSYCTLTAARLQAGQVTVGDRSDDACYCLRVRESSCKVKGKDRYEKEKSGILKTENNCIRIRIIGAENTVTVCKTQGS